MSIFVCMHISKYEYVYMYRLHMHYVYITARNICDEKQQCANGGVCVPKSASDFVCVCSTCGCLSSPPLTEICGISELYTNCHQVSIM